MSTVRGDLYTLRKYDGSLDYIAVKSKWPINEHYSVFMQPYIAWINKIIVSNSKDWFHKHHCHSGLIMKAV